MKPGTLRSEERRPLLQNMLLYGAGLVLGSANTVRHRYQGYVNPRPFDGLDVDRSIDHAIEIVDRLADRGQIEWAGKHVLELGPGPDLVTGAVIKHRGATTYSAVDLFDNRGQAHPDLYVRLEQRLGAPVDISSLTFLQTSFPDLPGAVSGVDIIISNACLEHVSAVGPLMRRLYALARPGSRMVHHIDGKTHMRWFRDHDPLNILRFHPRLYRNLLEFPGAPNRLRAHDFEQLAIDAGWQAQTYPDAIADSSYVRSVRLTREFRDVPDLAILAFTLIATR